MSTPQASAVLPQDEGIGAAAVRRSVEQIVASPLFSTSARLCRFLHYITEETLAGRAEGIKEYSIGVDVYERGADFEPRIDAIVRAEAGRMRVKLARFYARAPADIAVHIELPRGGYVPVFKTLRQVPALAVAPARRSQWPPIALASMALAAAASLVFWLSGGSAPRAGPLRIAVLPFISIGGPETDHLAAGLVQQLTGRLADEGGFQVSSRSKSDGLKASFKDDRNLAEIGAGLDVDGVVEGSMQGTGQGVRLTVRLVSVADGFESWSLTLESLPGQLVEFQARAVALITRTLRARCSGLRGLYRQSTADKEALSLYQRGFEAWLTQRRTGLDESVSYYRSAIRRDPAFGKAYEGLAASELYLAEFDLQNASQHVERAKNAALTALRLDDRLDDAHARLGNIYFRREWRFSEGEYHLWRTMVLAPGSAPPTRWYSLLARLHNRYSTAQEELQYGIMAHPQSEIMQTELGLLHFQAGRFAEAERQSRVADAIDPDYPLARQLAGLLREEAGLLKEAVAEFRSCAGEGELQRYCQAGLGHVLARSGQTEESRRIARQLLEAVPPSAMLAAVVYAGLGDREQALAALEEGYRVHDLELPFCQLDPRLRALKDEPRFRAVLTRLGLGEE